MTSDTSGRSWLAPSAYYDPDECCWKTSGAMFPSDWPTSSQTCPAWGMTRNGELFELPTPALPTAEPASSSLLPTPAVNDMGAGKTVEAWDEWTAKMQAKHGNGNGHGPSLAIEAQRLLPTPTSRDDKGANQRGDDSCLHGALLPTPRATDGTKGGPNQRGSSGDLMLPSAVMFLLPTPEASDATGRPSVQGARWPATERGEAVGAARNSPTSWGAYEPAIRRWERVTGRPAPRPTEPGRTGERLSPRFVEWMQGLPAGWVTDVLPRNPALKALGNGVVPQQAALALSVLHHNQAEAVA